ncbi:SLC13 family permease [Microbacterium keratanolyticum]
MSTVTRTRFATTPPGVAASAPRASRRHPGSGRIVSLSLVLASAVVLALFAAQGSASAMTGAPLSTTGALTIGVFLLAVWAWIATPLDDTLVALLAALALIAVGALPSTTFFAALGDETIWLLIGAFIIAAAVNASGLALRGAAQLVRHARAPRALFHLTTVALTLTTFAVPATSGRAALAVPVYAALAAALAGRAGLIRALALLFPTVILLSAVGSLLGAGAHIITGQIVGAATGQEFTFLSWLWFGLPLAIVSSHIACEIVLLRFTSRAERRSTLSISLGDIAATAPTPVQGPLTAVERRALLLLVGAIALWCTEPWHGISPALVALIGAVAAVTPGIGCTSMAASVKTVPWNLLLFLAATLALAAALTSSGAATWIGQAALAPLTGLGEAGAIVFVLAVVAVSLGAHLLIPSRSARSAALIPLVVALAPSVGVDPMAAAFASTAAAGFCHTLTSSAKPVAMFADPQIAPGGFRPADLRRLSALLAPTMFVLVCTFAFIIWPSMGMPLLR